MRSWWIKNRWWVIIVALVLIVVFQRGLSPIHWFLFSVYSNPIAWLLFVVACALGFLALGNESGNLGYGSLLLFLAWGAWFFLAKPVSLVGLYQSTRYEHIETLIPVSNPRPVSYAEAKTNFFGQEPEAGFGPGDLDYVRGKWIAEFGPSTLWNKLTASTQGFFTYESELIDKVGIVRQIMPFAESGMLWNSVGYFVHQQNPFVEFHEVLYIEDSETEGGHMAMMSLIKRRGWRRTPYVWRILIVHGDGRTEWLTPQQAENDERLSGVQLNPEWLETKIIQAYGWRNGVLEGIFTRRGRIQVQKSEINAENNPPYHLETATGPVWFTPFGPLKKRSMTGVMMHDSHDVDGTVYIWELEQDQAYQGLDTLAADIKASPHSQDVSWLRVSSPGSDEVRSGVHDVIELIPLPRQEKDGIILYFMGYVAVDPPTQTMFYTVINADTREVLSDVYDLDVVREWLRGETELSTQISGCPVTAAGAERDSLSLDIDSLSLSEVLRQMILLIERIEDLEH